MKTIKNIDLLNKIINDEEVPKKIKAQNNIYVFSKDRRRYEPENEPWCFLIFESNKLNDEVEIIEEDKKIKKLKLEHRKDSNQQVLKTDTGYLTMRKADVLMINKISELVDEVNKLKEDRK